MPAPDQYTHNFIYRLGEGQFILGECEFNKDKKASYRINSWSEPISHQFLTDFIGFIDRVKLRFDEWEQVRHVEIIEKGYTEP